MVEEIIKPLKRGQVVWFQPNVWHNGTITLGPRQYLERSRVIILEGVSSARTAMIPYLDCAIWVDGGTKEQCLERAILRDGEIVRDDLTRWKEFEEGWFSVDNTRQRCHRVKISEFSTTECSIFSAFS